MSSPAKLDAVVVGSGPNGLAAAITLARAGLTVQVFEANEVAGGGAKTEELTLPGFKHDVFSAVHPFAISSPFFRSLPLEHHGLEWIQPSAPLAHAIGETSVFLEESVEKTASQFGDDASRYRRIFGPLVRQWEDLFFEVLQPAFHLPRHPLLLARFGAMGMLSVDSFAKGFFREPRARALLAGIGAHSGAPLDRAGTASIAIMLAVAGHARGWPVPRGGSGAIAKALLSYFESQGGRVETGREVKKLADLPPSRFVFFDLSPLKIKSIFSASNEAGLANRFDGFRHGPGVFKMDWALSSPIPWTDPGLSRAGTIHLGGPLERIARSEASLAKGEHAKFPFVLLSQPTLFDPSRAPEGRHVAWAYCHVPAGSRSNLRDVIEDEIERYAPGFRSVVLARSEMDSKALEERNGNLVGGDVAGGEFRFWHMLKPRPGGPYEISRDRGFFICSASTPPGPGVHGMCGVAAAESAMGPEQKILTKPKGYVSRAGLT